MISVAVMAHPKRKRQAMVLHKKLIQYPFSSVRIVWDEKNDEWDTGTRAMMRGAAENGWHLVIQDDAILTPDFYANVAKCISAVPTKSVISLYTGKVKPLADRVQAAVDKADDGDWLNFYMLLWGVAILIPTEHIKPMLEFVGGDEYRDTQYDNRVGVFYQRNILPIYYTMPSLVDHDDDLGTLIPDHATQQPRVAHRLATGLIDWTDNVINI